ncbi:MAG: FMN-binding protein [Devosia nanyangense]|uniref:FMN-binding protein n=1 Tax=Devosia nanyangense TaxID=1228055 RepID=A0A933KZK2_9HYPH|nr:FMN-binding protein [Devosia nanyangense]
MKKILLPMVVLVASGAYVWSQQDRLNAETGFGLDATLDASSGTVPGPLPAADDARAATPPTPAIDTEPAPAAPAPLLRPATDTTVAQATVSEPDPASLLVAIGTSPSAPLPLPRPAQSVAAPARAEVLLAAASGTITTSPYKDGTYKGSAANAYYGLVQVQAQVQNGQLVQVKVLQYPSDRRTSRKINARALPVLQREAIQAQGSRIDYVSGATLSSAAFVKSLSNALSQAL